MVCQRTGSPAEWRCWRSGGGVPQSGRARSAIGGGIFESRGHRHAPQELGPGNYPVAKGRKIGAENDRHPVEHWPGGIPESELCGGHWTAVLRCEGATGSRTGEVPAGALLFLLGEISRGGGCAGTALAAEVEWLCI